MQAFYKSSSCMWSWLDASCCVLVEAAAMETQIAHRSRRGGDVQGYRHETTMDFVCMFIVLMCAAGGPYLCLQGSCHQPLLCQEHFPCGGGGLVVDV